MTTGALIRDLRIKAGLTQSSLANALHVTDKAVSKWERDLTLPDMSLLPKLAIILDTDVEILLHQSMEQEEWVGEIDIFDCDFAQIVYNKPLVYYLLIHFLLLDVTTIHVITSERNQEYLKETSFKELGFQFSFIPPKDKNVMLIEHPWFLFGSDLTQQFQAAMVSQKKIKLIPENQKPVFFFFPKGSPSKGQRSKCGSRTLGRGMVCLDMDDQVKILDVATFVKAYEQNSGLLIGSLEEVAYRKGIISKEQLITMAEHLPYGELLRGLLIGKPKVD